MYKILIDFGSLQLNPLFLVMLVVSLLLLALAQSYASAKKMNLKAALLVSLAFLVIGDAIAYGVFIALFPEYNNPNYIFPHVSIYSYGFMLMIAFVVGTIFLVKQGAKENPKVDVDTILDLMVWIIIGSIIGARLIYVLTQWGDYAANKETILKITEGGLSIHGGIFGAMVFGWAYCKIKGLDYWRMVDFTIIAVPLGMFFGRIGCFLNGCCYGIQCKPDFPLGVTYPNAAYWEGKGMPTDLASLYDAGLAAADFTRHPAPLYEAAGAVLIFWYLFNFRKHAAFKGHTFLMFIWLYSLLRFFVEFYRFGDPTDGTGSSIVLWTFITIAQLASLILAVIALVLMQDLKRRALISRMLKDSAKTPEPEKAAPKAEPSTDEEEEDEEIQMESEDADEDADKEEGFGKIS